jgi:hypothetical protein
MINIKYIKKQIIHNIYKKIYKNTWKILYIYKNKYKKLYKNIKYTIIIKICEKNLFIN